MGILEKKIADYERRITVMNKLEKANKIYADNLYLIVPTLTILISMYELIAGSNTSIKAMACIAIPLSMIYLSYLYIKGNKTSITLFLAQVYEFCYITFLCIARITHASDLVWQIFIFIVIFALFFIIGFRLRNNP